MHQRNFVTVGIEQNQAPTPNIMHSVFNVLLTPLDWLDSLLAYCGRVYVCWRVARLFKTDMQSAGVLLWAYRGKIVYWDDEAEPEQIEASDDFEDETEDELEDDPKEESVIVHPPLDRNFVAATAPTIPAHELIRRSK
jgi:hypothetical protein